MKGKKRNPRPWTAEDNAKLLETVEYVLNQGDTRETAFELYAADFNRTPGSVKFQFYALQKVGKAPKVAAAPAKPDKAVYQMLSGISDYIEAFEAENESLHKTVSDLVANNNSLHARIAEAEKHEAEFNHLLSIIDRSRKEAFAGDGAPKKYKVVDGVPVFEGGKQ